MTTTGPSAPPKLHNRRYYGLDDQGLYRSRLEVGMPLMGQNNLSEGALLRSLGHIRWEHLASILGVPSGRLVNDVGERVYASFFYVETSFPPERPINSFAENDQIEVLSTLSQHEHFLDGTHFLFPAEWTPEEKRLPASLEEATARGIPFVRMGNSFVVQFRGAAWLKASKPAARELSRIPQGGVPDYFADFRRAKSGDAFLEIPGGHSRLSTEAMQTIYEIVPERDVNGAGLLYFANYPVITDVCERRVLAAHFGTSHDTAEFFARRTVARRRSGYYGNADFRDRLHVEVEAHIRSSSANGPSYRHDLHTRVRVTRASDQKLIYVASTQKYVVHEAKELFDLLSTSDDGTPRATPPSGRPPSASQPSPSRATPDITDERQGLAQGPASTPQTPATSREEVADDVRGEREQRLEAGRADERERLEEEGRERVLISIWEEVLGVAGLHRGSQPFLEHGADSIQAAEVCAKIQSETGRHVTFDALIRGRTLGEQTRIVWQQWEPTAVMALRQGQTSATPLVFFHSLGGQPFVYLPIVRTLRAARTCFATTATYCLGTQSPPSSLTQVADYYVAALHDMNVRAAVPVGYSFGGILAMEFARRFHASGGVVPGAVMLDGVAPRRGIDRGVLLAAVGMLDLRVRRPSLPFLTAPLRATGLFDEASLGHRANWAWKPEYLDDEEMFERIVRYVGGADVWEMIKHEKDRRAALEKLVGSPDGWPAGVSWVQVQNMNALHQRMSFLSRWDSGWAPSSVLSISPRGSSHLQRWKRYVPGLRTCEVDVEGATESERHLRLIDRTDLIVEALDTFLKSLP